MILFIKKCSTVPALGILDTQGTIGNLAICKTEETQCIIRILDEFKDSHGLLKTRPDIRLLPTKIVGKSQQIKDGNGILYIIHNTLVLLLI